MSVMMRAKIGFQNLICCALGTVPVGSNVREVLSHKTPSAAVLSKKSLHPPSKFTYSA